MGGIARSSAFIRAVFMTPLNIAHRGGAKLWPENTLFAFAQAASAGFDGAELDVQLSRDGKLVVFHDFHLKPELCRHADGRWLARGERHLIRDLTSSELRGFDVGRIRPRTLYAQRHRVLHPHDGEHIPLLSDVIAAVRAKRPSFKLFIELKTSAEDRSLSAAPEKVAEDVIAELRDAGFTSNAVLIGFDWAALRHAKKIAPDIPCWFTTKRRAPHADRSWADGYHPSKFKGSIAEAIARAGGDGWLGSASQATRSRIDEAHRLGLKVGVWTVNDARSMRSFTRAGVAAIVTDRPDRLAALD
jgi:glycerophosphoryl diester phosphodiesterase